MAILQLKRHQDSEIEKKLGYSFLNKQLLEQALSHKSVDRRSKSRTKIQTKSNERLEFLGDSVLGFIITRLLFGAEPSISEGDMSRIRSSIVRNESLARKARESLDIQDYLNLGDREARKGLNHSPVLAADALEAIIGAVFIDGGLENAERVVRTLFAKELSGDIMPLASIDPKSELIRFVKKRGLGLVVFNTGERPDETSERRHHVTIFIEGHNGKKRTISRGYGASRRRAEQEAASRAIENLTGGTGAEFVGKERAKTYSHLTQNKGGAPRVVIQAPRGSILRYVRTTIIRFIHISRAILTAIATRA